MKDPRPLLPLWPIGIAYWFQHDMTSGVIMNRAIKEADQILGENPEFMRMPGGMPSIEEIIKKSGT